MTAAIEFRDVSFRTPQGRLLLDSISFAIEEGTTTAILGRSGSGKTTLLRTVNRMVEPTSGDVLVGGKSVRDSNLIHLRRGIGYVIQETGLFPHFTVERNVGMVPEVSRHARAMRCRKSRTRTLVRRRSRSRRPSPSDILTSFRRTAPACGPGPRSCRRAAQFCFMDEPFGALDPLTRAEMQDMLRDLLRSPGEDRAARHA